jgi:hypothetical protein
MNAVRPGTVFPTALSTVSSGRTAGQSPPSDVLDVGVGLVGVVVAVDVGTVVADALALALEVEPAALDGVFVADEVEPLVHAARPTTRVNAVASAVARNIGPRRPGSSPLARPIPMGQR